MTGDVVYLLYISGLFLIVLGIILRCCEYVFINWNPDAEKQKKIFFGIWVSMIAVGIGMFVSLLFLFIVFVYMVPPLL